VHHRGAPIAPAVKPSIIEEEIGLTRLEDGVQAEGAVAILEAVEGITGGRVLAARESGKAEEQILVIVHGQAGVGAGLEGGAIVEETALNREPAGRQFRPLHGDPVGIARRDKDVLTQPEEPVAEDEILDAGIADIDLVRGSLLRRKVSEARHVALPRIE